MKSRDLETGFQQEAEFIRRKVALGELSQDEGDFLIKEARARLEQKLARLRRSDRRFHLVLGWIGLLIFLGGLGRIAYLLYSSKMEIWPLWVGLGGVILLCMSLYLEIKRLEKTFERTCSRALFEKILKSPEMDFEWKRQSVVQVHLLLKNESNLYAGLPEDNLCDLMGRIVDSVHEVFEDGKSIIEWIGHSEFVISWPAVTEPGELARVLQKIQAFFEHLRLHDGEWFDKSVRMGAGISWGTFWCGNLGQRLRVFRTLGKKREVARTLAEASGWEEIWLDEETAGEVEKWIYWQPQEPIFLRSSKELIKVCRLAGWKDSPQCLS